MKPELLLFDLDGTLHKLRERNFLKSPIYFEMRARSIEFLIERLKISKEKASGIYEDILERYNHDLSLGFEKEFNIPREEYFNFAWDLDVAKHIKKNEELKELIQLLSKSYKLAVLSDAPKIWILKVLKYLEIEACFSRIFHGEGDIRKKTGQYSYVLDVFKLSAEKVCMMGDGEKTDIIIPKEVGLKTIFIGDLKSGYADFSVKDILEIKDILVSKFEFTRKMVMGALHFTPLIGYEGYIDYNLILEKAMLDLKALEEGGVDAIIVENNYDFPHRIKETSEAREMMMKLTKRVVDNSRLPVGISLLWNDFEGAFSIAKEIGAKFIRVPVFVDDVKTDFGEIYANPDEVISYRDKIDAKDVLIFADIQVKHAEMLDKEKTLEKSALEAREKGADAVIVTGKWTGDCPLMDDLNKARSVLGSDFPIIVGSGADKDNVSKLFSVANGAIVSTSLKEGDAKSSKEERNLKPYQAKFDVGKIKGFMAASKC